ncbi:MAG: hypothetical protein ACOCWR_00630 [Oceanidesulfovibrio sp.]
MTVRAWCAVSARAILTLLLALGALWGCHAADCHAQGAPLLAESYFMSDNGTLPPLDSRIRPAPEFILRYLAAEHEQGNLPTIPGPAPADPVFEKAFASILSDLSEPLRDLLRERLTGIFLVDDLGCSGYSEEFLGDDGQRLGFIVLSAGALSDKPANEWISWKENSTFQRDADIRLTMAIEEPENDTIDNAVRFIMLHELGHVLGYVGEAHPAFMDITSEPWEDYPFLGLSWEMDNGRVRSRFDNFFPERTQLSFYHIGEETLTISRAPDIYETLRRTNFASLYGAMCIHEDFAESFATYTHVVRGKRPWRIVLAGPEGERAIVRSCWEESRCAGKKAFFDSFFAGP